MCGYIYVDARLENICGRRRGAKESSSPLFEIIPLALNLKFDDKLGLINLSFLFILL